MKKCVTLLCVVWICIVWGQIAQAQNRWAVIIGVEEYQNSALNLKYTGDDAEAIYQILKTQGDIPEQNFHFLLNGDATQSAISGAFRDWLPERVNSGDFVVIYYSGHGIQGPDREPIDEQDGLDEYLVPYDFDISKPETIGETGVRDDLIAEWLGNLPSDTVVIFDSCYSGGGIKAISPGIRRTPYALVPALKKVKTEEISAQEEMQKEFFGLSERITFLSSCQSNQEALEFPHLQHGIFTYYLLWGLQGHADQNGDGQVFVSEAFTYIKHQMVNDVCLTVLNQEPLLWTKKDPVLVSVTPSPQTSPVEVMPPSTPTPLPDSGEIQVDLRFDILEKDGTIKPGVENEEYQSGSTVKLFFKVTRDCYLFVFNIDQEGHVYNFHPLDPEADESVWVKKDREYLIEARLDEVLGVERFYAVASAQPFSLSQDVLPAVDKEFQTKGLQLEPMKELDTPFSYKTISFKHR